MANPDLASSPFASLMAVIGQPDELPVPTERRMRWLARELSMEMVEPANVIKKIGMSVEEWDATIQHPRFKQMLTEEKERWESSLNSKERVEIKTWFILEDVLEHMPKYFYDPHFGDTAKVQLFQAMQKQVGIGSKEGAAAGTGERYNININIGGEEIKAQGEITPQGNVIEGEVVNEKPMITINDSDK
jgi:hypothetical protein